MEIIIAEKIENASFSEILEIIRNLKRNSPEAFKELKEIVDDLL